MQIRANFEQIRGVKTDLKKDTIAVVLNVLVLKVRTYRYVLK